MLTTMPAKDLGTLTSISKVKINHPTLPYRTMLVYYQTGYDFRKQFLLRFFYDISLNDQHCLWGKGTEVVIFFFMKGIKDIECSVNCWVFQILLADIVHPYQALFYCFCKNVAKNRPIGLRKD